MITSENLNFLFNPERYRSSLVDIVHYDSVKKVADGRKNSDISEIRTAQIVVKRVEALVKAGVNIRFIDDLQTWTKPAGFVATQPIILGGAFIGECLLAYQKTLENNGILYSVDPQLILRAGV
jgi:hypothetical protein